jgi:hypothetical protein
MNVSGLGLLHEKTNNRRRLPTADRPHLELPEHVVQDIGSGFDVDAFVRPTLDVFWQAFDMPRCPDYSAEGVWAPREAGLEDLPE